MEHGGHHEEPTEAEAVDPGRDGLPVVIRQEVEVGAAEDAGNDPQLEAGRGTQVLQGRPPAWGPGQCRAREPPPCTLACLLPRPAQPTRTARHSQAVPPCTVQLGSHKAPEHLHCDVCH